MSALHILIIPSWYPEYPGDINGSFFKEQAEALAKHGCKVGVIYPQLRSLRNWRGVLKGESGLSHEVENGIPTYRWHGVNWFPRIAKLNGCLWELHGAKLYEKYVDEHGKPDIIHAHSLLYAGHLASKISEKSGIPFVVTEHSSAYARGLYNKSQIALAQTVAPKAGARIAVSTEFTKLLSKLFTCENNDWEYIPNIVNQDFFDRSLDQKNEDEDSFVFLNVAMLDRNKDQATLLKAFSKAYANNDKLRLRIGGDGPCREELESLSEELGISDSVTFLGKLSRSQVIDEIQASDAFVLSSIYETFGVVVVEAMALGKPVISTSCGGPESIVSKETGILVPTTYADKLGHAMISLFHNRHKYDQQSIRNYCYSRFSEESVVSSLKGVYQSLVKT
ncbi:TPA: glycosyltransferase [Pseudomonas aeruginosa]